MRRLLVTVVLVATATGAATLSGADTTTSAPGASTTSTTAKVVRVAPLTGRPDPARITRHRPAVTVKIDNTYYAHPQYGIDQADIVYEEIVEGGITRLAAVFNSSAPARVGPIRSVRRTDREIVTSLGGVFAFSGGAAYAIASIQSAPVKLFSQSNSGTMMYRDPKRPAPHNLFVNVSRLMHVGGRPAPPRPAFTYSSARVRSATAPVRSFTVGFANGYATTWTWDARRAAWDRSLFSRPDVAADGRRVAPTNVLVMKVHYRGGVGVEGAEAVLTGRGAAMIFTQHHELVGTWSRASLRNPISWRFASGKVIALSPGQTWVELLDVSEHVTVAH